MPVSAEQREERLQAILKILHNITLNISENLFMNR